MPIDEPQAMPVRPRVRQHEATSFSPAREYTARGDFGDLDDPATMDRAYTGKQKQRSRYSPDEDQDGETEVHRPPVATPAVAAPMAVKAGSGIIGSITQNSFTAAIIIVLVVALLVAVAYIVRTNMKKSNGAIVQRPQDALSDGAPGSGSCPMPGANQGGKPRQAGSASANSSTPGAGQANSSGPANGPDSGGKAAGSDVYARQESQQAPASAPAPIPKASLDQLRRLHEGQTATPNAKTQAVVHNEDEISKLMNANSEVPTQGDQ